MPAEAYTKLNTCAWFIPKPNYRVFEVDLKQADAQVVAWEAKDATLIRLFQEAEVAPPQEHSETCPCLHCRNCMALFHAWTEKGRYFAKQGVHASNYLVSAKTLAITLGIDKKQAQLFIDTWFRLHPEIQDWHVWVMTTLEEQGYHENIFGFKDFWFDRINWNTLKEALAWRAQSVVAEIINRGMRRLDEEDPWIELFLQRHDSLIGQYPIIKEDVAIETIYDKTEVVVPFETPLVIGREIMISDKSWGQVKTVISQRAQLHRQSRID